MAFRLLRSLIPSKTTGEGHNVLIYGAGDGGEMVLRELKNNPDWNCIPVGFIDDDPLKKGKVIHGLQVFDANGTLSAVCSSKNVAEILISIREFSPAKLEAVKELCRRSEISLRRAEIKIEPIEHGLSAKSPTDAELLKNFTITIDSMLSRSLLIGAAIVVLLFAYFFIKWSFANMAAMRTDLPEIADHATRLGPDDSQTHFTAAALYRKNFSARGFSRDR